MRDRGRAAQCTTAAILPLLVDVGAFVAQVAILHMDRVHTLIPGGIIDLQRDRVRSSMG